MKCGSTAKVLEKCVLRYHRILKCGMNEHTTDTWGCCQYMNIEALKYCRIAMSTTKFQSAGLRMLQHEQIIRFKMILEIVIMPS